MGVKIQKEVIILGTGASRTQCPFDCETWGVNATYIQREERLGKGLPFRHDKLFITDTLFSNRGTMHFDINRINRLKKEYNTHIIMLHQIKLGKYEVRGSQYPLKRIVEKFGCEYFTSTICYMLAYALDKSTVIKNGKLVLNQDPYLNLRLYGVDMVTSSEYLLQKGGVEFWLGFAKGLGIDYQVAEGSAVMKTPTGVPYGKKQKINLEQIDPYNLLKRKK